MRLRFTIRDLLWLAVVVALAVGWWLNNRQLHKEIGKPASSMSESELSENIIQLEKLRAAKRFEMQCQSGTRPNTATAF